MHDGRHLLPLVETWLIPEEEIGQKYDQNITVPAPDTFPLSRHAPHHSNFALAGASILKKETEELVEISSNVGILSCLSQTFPNQLGPGTAYLCYFGYITMRLPSYLALLVSI
ncbi:hypothetical protein K435DRAFT_405577 [Dendrothele bispora CBS 962.96]|uniref:Uncharacterized protein n=1 Tax=Dendrothele bispora (strain CBS 962.96) TaxID=1314807 RepID=A0A4S8MFF3_DENBC|nr:hypothetical protein K435DRAFT_405577 [Dendrothele bispora CBS 962.96]